MLLVIYHFYDSFDDQREKRDKDEIFNIQAVILELNYGLRALKIGEEIHNTTGLTKIPLKDIANQFGKDMGVEDIKRIFRKLVELGIIGNDGDEEHLNYDEKAIKDIGNKIQQKKDEHSG